MTLTDCQHTGSVGKKKDPHPFRSEDLVLRSDTSHGQLPAFIPPLPSFSLCDDGRNSPVISWVTICLASPQSREPYAPPPWFLVGHRYLIVRNICSATWGTIAFPYALSAAFRHPLGRGIPEGNPSSTRQSRAATVGQFSFQRFHFLAGPSLSSSR